MILLDTDILTLLMAGNPSVVASLGRADDEVAITVITKVEILRGRFDFLLKASDGDQLSIFMQLERAFSRSSGKSDPPRAFRDAVGPFISSPLSETAPMVSQAKIDANKRNAARSTGPRPAAGKDKVRFNAVTHGLTAATLVLPHEDEQAYQHRLETWTRELNAPGDMGRYLVERMVKISWQLDRADTAEQARLAGRIQDAHRLFADGGPEPAEMLFARLVGMEEAQPALSLGSRRDGPGPVNSPALLLIALEASAEGCRRLLDEWTRILDWLGPLGPEGIASTEFDSRRDNIKRALQLVGVPFRDPEDPPVTTNDPLTAPFVRAWQALNDQAMTQASGQEIEEEDWPAALERQAELDRPYWAAVAVELLKLATERRARLKTMLARHQDNEDEARPRLAAEASFDDTAEGERLHRYQERWGRSLLRTLAALEELRSRGRLDHQEVGVAPVGQDSDPVVPFIEERIGSGTEPPPTRIYTGRAHLL